MGQALYRKYRSRGFNELVGQEHIVKTLAGAIKSGRISHAYLFTGPRGVGKTSVARILAHEVNQLPYDDESIHLDIIEIDAASNRRIDEIRDLRERVRVAPATARYKVYIIDEVHMLTREAFNALLKTLEEPPAHCIFILATTEAHKLPETIISRTQRFEFKPVSANQVAAHLSKIAKREKIDISKEALQLLAQFGEGSFRDSIGYLDQLSSAGQAITAADVRAFLGLPSAAEIAALADVVSAADSQAVLASLGGLYEQGLNAAAIAKALASELRQRLIAGSNQAWMINLLKKLVEVPASTQPKDSLEIALLEACSLGPSKPDDNNSRHRQSSSDKSVEHSKDEATRPGNLSGQFSLDHWDQVLDRVKNQAASLYTALRLAHTDYADGILTLNFQFPLHQKKLNQAKNKQLLAEIIEDTCGAKLAIECTVNKSPAPQADLDMKERSSEPAASSLQAITNIFGTAEMLET